MKNSKIDTITIYHGGAEIVTSPEIRIGKYTKDFYWGFYCTLICEQAERWALRNIKKSIVNVYNCKINEQLNVKRFEKINDEWLDFVDGNISRNAFWELAKFKYPTHQISFHTARSLACLTYERSYELK